MIEVSGWIGAILVLYAYFMVSSGKVDGNSGKFQMINIVGAAFLVVYTLGCQAYASMAVNIIWVGIGLNTALRNKKEVLMTTKMKLLACAIALFALVGNTAINAQETDFTESSDEMVLEDSSETTSDEVEYEDSEEAASSEEF